METRKDPANLQTWDYRVSNMVIVGISASFLSAMGLGAILSSYVGGSRSEKPEVRPTLQNLVPTTTTLHHENYRLLDDDKFTGKDLNVRAPEKIHERVFTRY